MAWTYTQNFDSLSTADLNGQDSWSGSANFDVETSVVLEGTKSVSCASSGGDEIGRSITGISSGRVSCLIRVTSTSNSPAYFILRSGGYSGDSYCVLRFKDGNIEGRDNLTYKTLQAYSADTTYKVAFNFGETSGKYDIWVDDVKKGDQYAMLGSSNVDYIQFRGPDASSTTAYFDDIKSYSPTITITVNDTVSLTDSILGNIDAIKLDTLSLTDSITTSRGVPVTVLDTISLTDSILGDISSISTDTVNMTDSITVRSLWDNLVKYASSWVDKVKNSSSWINKNK